MTLILLYRSYLHYLSSIYKPIFVGSNLLLPAGPFKFIIDKEEIINMVEEVSTEILSKTTGVRTNCRLDEEQKKNLRELLSLQKTHRAQAYETWGNKITIAQNRNLSTCSCSNRYR